MEKYILVEHQNNKTFTELVNQKIAQVICHKVVFFAIYGDFIFKP